MAAGAAGAYSVSRKSVAAALPGVAIAEVKRSQWSSQSAFVQQLHDLHIQPTSISKYCLAIMRFYPWLKQNRFKEIALQIQRILDQT